MSALPLEAVAETMRPLPISPVSAAPAFVRGVSLVRGSPSPVVNLALLLGGTQAEPGPGRRFVAMRVPEGNVALEVDEVVGLRWLQEQSLEEAPALLQGTGEGHVERLGSLDGRLLAVLGTARLLPEDFWNRLRQGHAG
jgi:purine-binding chemotaxis protein CheW